MRRWVVILLGGCILCSVAFLAWGVPQRSVRAQETYDMYFPSVSVVRAVRSGLDTFFTGDRLLEWRIAMTKEPNEVFLDISGGVLKVTITDNSVRTIIAPQMPGWQPEKDFMLEVDARFTTDEWLNGLGLVFGANEDWSEYYDFKIGFNFEQHYWAVAKFKDDNITYLTNDGWRGGPNFMNNQYNWNHLTVIRQGDEIQVLCNDKLLPGGTFTDPSFIDSRWVGLTVTSYEWDSGSIEFDNFKLTPLE